MLRDQSAEFAHRATGTPAASPTPEKRIQLGAYYTPLKVASLLSGWAIEDKRSAVLEPCFGGCDFLEALRDRFRAVGLRDPAKHLFGCDIDSEAFNHLERRVGGVVQGSNFVRGDFLKLSPGYFGNGGFEAIVGNPPYIKSERTSAEQKQSVERLPDYVHSILNGRANLWAYFVLHSLAFLKRGGRLALVLPGAYLSAEYALPLRDYLKESFQSLVAISVGERLFVSQGTEERTVILLAKEYRKGPASQDLTLYCDGLLELEQLMADLGDENLSDELVGKHSQVDAETLESHQDLLQAYGAAELGTLGTSRIGIVLGDKKFFVKPLKEWADLDVTDVYLEPILSKAQLLVGTNISSKDTSRAAFMKGANFFLNTRGKRVSSKLKAYLDTYSDDDKKENSTFARRQVWYQPDDGLRADAFLSGLSHFSPKLVLNQAGVQATNTLYRFNFKDKFRKKDHQATSIAMFTSTAQLSAELLGRQYGSGALKLEPNEFERIALVLPPNKSKEEIERAFASIHTTLREGKVAEATSIANGFVYGVHAETQARLNAIDEALLRIRRHRFRT